MDKGGGGFHFLLKKNSLTRAMSSGSPKFQATHGVGTHPDALQPPLMLRQVPIRVTTGKGSKSAAHIVSVDPFQRKKKHPLLVDFITVASKNGLIIWETAQPSLISEWAEEFSYSPGATSGASTVKSAFDAQFLQVFDLESFTCNINDSHLGLFVGCRIQLRTQIKKQKKLYWLKLSPLYGQL